MTKTATLNELLQLVSVQLGVKQVKADQRFMEDLGAESADIVNIIASVEDKYNLSLDVTEISNIRTTNDLFNLIESNSLSEAIG